MYINIKARKMFTLKPQNRKLTKNEKSVLCCLMDDCKTPDIKIAEKLKITTQAVGKIRKRLENENIIKGYCAMLDFEKIGVKILSLVLIKTECKAWHGESEDILKGIKEAPYIIEAFRVPGNSVSLILLYGFKSMEEMEGYFQALQSKVDNIEIVNIYTFSPCNVIRMSPKELLKRVITKPDEVARPLPNIKPH